MAYFNQEKKKAIAPQVKAILNKYGLKGSLSVEHYSSVILTIWSGKIDFCSLGHVGYAVNTYRIESHYEGIAKECLLELRDALNGKGSSIQNHDNSDPYTDYFDVGRYINIHIGGWDKEYVLE